MIGTVNRAAVANDGRAARSRPVEISRADAMPLRIALVTGNFGYVHDGASQALNMLVSHLENSGHAVRIYSPGGELCRRSGPSTIVSVPSIRIPRRREYRLALGLPQAQRRDLLSFKPDVLHLSAPDPLGLAALRLARNERWPVVASLHTRFETYLEHYGLGWLRPWVERRLLDFYRRADLVLSPTRCLGELLAQQGMGSKVAVWSRGVDGIKFNPRNRDLSWRRGRGFQDEDIVLLFLGRLVREKGVDLFADTVKLLRQQGIRVRALVVGDGPERRCLTDRLPDAEYTGFLSGEELGRVVASADIFVNPSRSEAFGNVNLEAMAAGLAIVLADEGNSRELIEHERTGILCPAKSAEGYADAVRRLISDAALRRRLGVAARLASESYCWDRVLDEVILAYREAIQRLASAATAHKSSDCEVALSDLAGLRVG